MSSKGSIFISYRRSGSISEAGRIYDRLVTEFGKGNVFKDVDSIPLGIDFAEYIAQEVGKCQALLVIIDKTWVTVKDIDGNRRLYSQNDFVRIEIEAALEREIPIIPILLEGVSIPDISDLPESLHPLVRRNGVRVGHDPRFHSDMNRLIKGLRTLIFISDETSDTKPIEKPRLSKLALAALSNISIEQKIELAKTFGLVAGSLLPSAKVRINSDDEDAELE